MQAQQEHEYAWRLQAEQDGLDLQQNALAASQQPLYGQPASLDGQIGYYDPSGGAAAFNDEQAALQLQMMLDDEARQRQPEQKAEESLADKFLNFFRSSKKT